jgi:hypothetical protein
MRREKDQDSRFLSLALRIACVSSYAGLAWVAIMPAILTLKGIVLAGLMQAQNLIRSIDGPGGIDLQFRIMTPDGDFLISMTLADDASERRRQLQHISMFMAWKMAAVFTVAGELINPDAVYCCGATRDEQIAVISAIERNPIRFGNPEWLAPDHAAGEIAALLPHGKVTLDAAGVASLDAYFGARGKFPAVRLGDGTRN